MFTHIWTYNYNIFRHLTFQKDKISVSSPTMFTIIKRYIQGRYFNWNIRYYYLYNKSAPETQVKIKNGALNEW
jgi:hypothetical protein